MHYTLYNTLKVIYTERYTLHGYTLKYRLYALYGYTLKYTIYITRYTLHGYTFKYSLHTRLGPETEPSHRGMTCNIFRLNLTELVPTFAVRETASLGIMGAPRVPPLNPSESIVL